MFGWRNWEYGLDGKITPLVRVPLAINGPHLSISHLFLFLFLFIFLSPLSSSSARREGGACRAARRAPTAGCARPPAAGLPPPATLRGPRRSLHPGLLRLHQIRPPAAASSALPCGARRPRPPLPAMASARLGLLRLPSPRPAPPPPPPAAVVGPASRPPLPRELPCSGHREPPPPLPSRGPRRDRPPSRGSPWLDLRLSQPP